MLVLLLACTGADPKPDDTADTDTAPDTDTDTQTDGPGFHLSGTLDGADLDLDCTIATAFASFARSGKQVQLSAGCTDTGTPDTPTASVTISGETPGTYSDCGYTVGDATIQVSIGGITHSCMVDGGTFDVDLAAVDPAGTADLHWSGTVHWETGSTALQGVFDVTGSCSEGC